MTITEPPAIQPTEQESVQLNRPQKRNWLRRLSWLAVALGIIAFLVNGIVSRKVIHHYLNKGLEAKGMTGSVEIEGSILNGFQVNQLSYTGEQGIQSLSIDHAVIDYQMMKLFDYKVDLVVAEKIESTIDIAKFPPSTETAKSSKWKTLLDELRPLLMYPALNLSDLDITLLNNGEKLLNWKLGSIQHEAETEKIEFNQSIIKDATKLTSPEQSAVMVWKQGRLEFNQLSILPELSLNHVSIDWSSEFVGNVKLNYNDTLVSVEIGKNASIKLLKGEIDSDKIFKTLRSLGISTSDLDAGIILDELDLNLPVDHVRLPASQWKINGSLGIKSARWKTYTTKKTKLEISQNNKRYQVNIDGNVLNNPLTMDISGNWIGNDTWWEYSDVEVSFQTQLNDDILALFPETAKIPTDIKLNESRIRGVLNLSLENKILNESQVNLEIAGVKANDAVLPVLDISASYIEEIVKLNLKPKDSSNFNLEGEYEISNKQYQSSVRINTPLDDSPWLNTLAGIFQCPFTLKKQLDLKWNGNGNLKTNSHRGTLIINDLTLIQKDAAPVTISAIGSYDWPKSLDLETINITQEELSAQVSLNWDGKIIQIKKSQIKNGDQLIGSITGKLPFTADIDTRKNFFNQTEAWDISIYSEKLALERLAGMLPFPSDLKAKLEGSLQTKLSIAGSPRMPEMNGNIDLKAVNDMFDLGLDNMSLNAKLKTVNELLKISGYLLETGKKTNIISLNVELPFTPHQWLEDDNLLETIQTNSELKGTAEIKQLPLEKFGKLIPKLEKFKGVLDAKAVFQGKITDPKYKIDFYAKLPIVKIRNSGLDDITDIQIKGTLDEKMIINGEIDAEINGGKFMTKLTIDVTDPKVPVFDVELATDHALVHRDDVLAMRANANLNLKGTLEKATITGNIGILESLFYKDVDLIPIGIPSSAIGGIKLPSLNSKAKQTLPIPDPFAKWNLDLTIKTIDPILIRGNVGNGQIQGSIKVKGTLAKPRLDGTLYAKNVKAKLPFSLLRVDNGQIIFKPNKGLIPSLDIRGKSQVGVHNVNIYAYGSADDPKITLSSYPALPENEIMTLIATGATNSGLANQDVATFKALQLLLLELKQRNDRPDGNQLFSKLLEGIDDLDLKVGELNELTGETYASATVKLNRRWYLTAQIDNNQPTQTRGLVIFALRFQ